MLWTALAAGLAAAGLAMAMVFVAGADGRRAPGLGPGACATGAAGCTDLSRTRQARVLGVPNALLGTFYYAAVLVAALTGALPALAPWFLAAGLVSVALGVYLTVQLLAVLRVPCGLCLTSHGLNLALTVIYALLWLRL